MWFFFCLVFFFKKKAILITESQIQLTLDEKLSLIILTRNKVFEVSVGRVILRKAEPWIYYLKLLHVYLKLHILTNIFTNLQEDI